MNVSDINKCIYIMSRENDHSLLAWVKDNGHLPPESSVRNKPKLSKLEFWSDLGAIGTVFPNWRRVSLS